MSNRSIISELITLFGKKGVFAAIVLVIVLFGYSFYSTPSGQYVELFGVKVFTKKESSIQVSLIHSLQRTSFNEVSEELEITIADFQTLSKLSQNSKEVTTILFALPNSGEHNYVITGKFSHSEGVINIQGFGESTFRDGQTYELRHEDAENGNGWDYFIIDAVK